MRQKTNGGPVYPTNESNYENAGGYCGSGLTLRDHFAGLAMQGIVSSIHNEEDYQRIWKLAQFHNLKVSEWIARDSYKQADAMLRARGE